MDYLKFFLSQCLIFGVIVPLIFAFDSLIGPPFTRADLIAGALSLPFSYFTWKAMEKLAAHFNGVRLPARILLSIPAFILSAILTGYVTYLFF